MSLVLGPIVELYRYVLAPVSPFTWFGLEVSTLDVAATIRLCFVLRQLREQFYRQHLQESKAKGVKPTPEPRSFVRDAAATLLVVYGGETITGPFLGVPPSFMISGVVPILYTVFQALVDTVPSVPAPAITHELPLSFLDGLSRAYLLCNLIPPSVTSNVSAQISTSPWTLLLTSFITANAGFFLTGLSSLLHPFSLTLTTPTELLPYGWTTTDLWCAPLITGLYAFLTHAQPFWGNAHGVINTLLGGGEAKPIDPEVARAACAVILSILFSTRAVRNFGSASVQVNTPPGKLLSNGTQSEKVANGDEKTT
ncbi:hypothetical protein C8Q75DRAFT_792143 [Abortiporus biennis]|nr:hypothetical protein C8Q75DRAFT_792143 [Abortiporus biennis]